MAGGLGYLTYWRDLSACTAARLYSLKNLITMKNKVAIQPWQMTRMKSLNFAELFKEARKKKQFTLRDYVTEIGNKYAHLVEENDTNTYNGVEFANMIAANFGIKDTTKFADCALCVQFVVSVRRDENNDVRIKFKKMKEQ